MKLFRKVDILGTRYSVYRVASGENEYMEDIGSGSDDLGCVEVRQGQRLFWRRIKKDTPYRYGKECLLV